MAIVLIYFSRIKMDWLHTNVVIPEDPEQLTDDIVSELEIITSLGSDHCLQTAIQRFRSFRTHHTESRFGTKSRYTLRIPLINPNQAIRRHLSRVFERQATAFKVYWYYFLLVYFLELYLMWHNIFWFRCNCRSISLVRLCWKMMKLKGPGISTRVISTHVCLKTIYRLQTQMKCLTLLIH